MEHNRGNRDDAASDLVARGRSKEIRSSSDRGKSRSKSRHHEEKCQ